MVKRIDLVLFSRKIGTNEKFGALKFNTMLISLKFCHLYYQVVMAEWSKARALVFYDTGGRGFDPRDRQMPFSFLFCSNVL